jgi:hypothetical protein
LQEDLADLPFNFLLALMFPTTMLFLAVLMAGAYHFNHATVTLVSQHMCIRTCVYTPFLLCPTAVDPLTILGATMALAADMAQSISTTAVFIVWIEFALLVVALGCVMAPPTWADVGMALTDAASMVSRRGAATRAQSLGHCHGSVYWCDIMTTAHIIMPAL